MKSMLVTLTTEELRQLVMSAVEDALSKQAKPAPGPRFMSSTKFARELGVSDRTVRHWCLKFNMPHQMAGSSYRIEPAKALAWLDENPRMRKAR